MLRSCLSWALAGLWNIQRNMSLGWELTSDEKASLELCRSCAHRCFYQLHCEAAVIAHPGFNLIPKYHLVDHMVRRSCRTSISSHIFWCFRCEDFMGRMAKLCGKVHGAVVHKRAIERWIVQFWLWLKESDPSDE